ncbi:hypothetical protein BKA81DRAFT_177976 [Phyllosticta paracitricarpa]
MLCYAMPRLGHASLTHPVLLLCPSLPALSLLSLPNCASLHLLSFVPFALAVTGHLPPCQRAKHLPTNKHANEANQRVLPTRRIFMTRPTPALSAAAAAVVIAQRTDCVGLVCALSV